MNDQMRAEFLSAFREEYGMDIAEYANSQSRKAAAGMAIWAWEQSRASIVVELPEEEEHKGVHYDIDYMPTDAVIEAITKTGVRVK